MLTSNKDVEEIVSFALIEKNVKLAILEPFTYHAVFDAPKKSGRGGRPLLFCKHCCFQPFWDSNKYKFLTLYNSIHLFHEKHEICFFSGIFESRGGEGGSFILPLTP